MQLSAEKWNSAWVSFPCFLFMVLWRKASPTTEVDGRLSIIAPHHSPLPMKCLSISWRDSSFFLLNGWILYCVRGCGSGYLLLLLLYRLLNGCRSSRLWSRWSFFYISLPSSYPFPSPSLTCYFLYCIHIFPLQLLALPHRNNRF